MKFGGDFFDEILLTSSYRGLEGFSSLLFSLNDQKYGHCGLFLAFLRPDYP